MVHGLFMMPIRVLITDDSAFMRRALRTMLQAESDIEVVDVAPDGKVAVEMAERYRPDVITLDIEMPVMDGLTALRHIMRKCPTQVLMCSSLTTEGSVEALQALRLGAADFIAKDQSNFSLKITDLREDLIRRVRALAGSRRPAGGSKPALKPKSPANTGTLPPLSDRNLDLVVIASSTGGPPVLETLLTAVPAGLRCPVVVAQHMPRVFTESMAKRLDDVCAVPAVLLNDGDLIKPGVIHICAGGTHTHLCGTPGLPTGLHVKQSDEPRGDLYKPSASVLFETASQFSAGRTLAIVLTGIGDDGLRGVKALHPLGATVLTQSEQSCVVYGMPRAVDEAGLSHASMAPGAIAKVLSALKGRAAA
ncbi:MAG: chemotaxis response regulator protein-glutamate methylesterase [Planctomycetota bacterium]